MLLYITTIFLSFIVTFGNSYINSKKLSFESIGEFLGMSLIIIVSKKMNFDDFVIFYFTLSLFTASNLLIRRKGFTTLNIVTTIIMLTFTFSQIPILLYQLALSRNIVDSFIESYITTSLVIFLTGFFAIGSYFFTVKLVKYKDQFINIRLAFYNIITLFSIILVHRFKIQLSINNEFYYETAIFMFLALLLLILFLYLSIYFLQLMKVDLEILSTKNIESQEEINNAFRKNHNTTNLLLTVNYLLKEKEYDKALQYLKDKR